MQIVHNFVNSNSIGGIGEAIFYLILSNLGEVQTVTKEKVWQKKGVDFILDGVYYDTKFDTKAFSTGNVALETVSRRKDGEVIKAGWAFTSEADCIAYIFLENLSWSMYFFTPREIKEFVDGDSYLKKAIKNYGYESEVVLVPLEDLSHKLKLQVPIVGDFTEIHGIEKVHSYLKSKKEKV